MENEELNNEEPRTFETRLQFINEIFAHPFTRSDILAHCIEYKLKKSYEFYEDDLKRSVRRLQWEEPLKILRKLEGEAKETDKPSEIKKEIVNNDNTKCD